MNSIITRAGLPTLSQGDSLMIGINCAVVGLAAFFLGTAAMPRVMKSRAGSPSRPQPSSRSPCSAASSWR